MDGNPTNHEAALSDRLFAYISTYCAVKSELLSVDTVINDIGLDSLSMAQMIAALEAEFGFELEEQDVTRLLEARSIGHYLDVMDAVHKRQRPGVSRHSPAT